MINLKVDEGYALDYLSILEVKKDKIKSVKSFNNYNDCLNFLVTQNPKVIKIIRSKEYKKLVKINEKVFEAVDLAKENKISAKEVDLLNTERYFSKIRLQKKYFSKNVMEEKKI